MIDIYRKYLSFDRGLMMYFAPGGACKQNPSCSLFMRQAIVDHGVVKGLHLGTIRIINCR